MFVVTEEVRGPIIKCCDGWQMRRCCIQELYGCCGLGRDDDISVRHLDLLMNIKHRVTMAREDLKANPRTKVCWDTAMKPE